MPKKNSIKHNLIGRKIGRLTIIAASDVRKYGRQRFWLCLCECGTEKLINQSSLINELSHSCGCLQRELLSKRKKTHGKRRLPEYEIWAGMWKRCTNPNAVGYKNYGGRGISVCERWRDFENFLADMGLRPSPNHQIDRFPDNDGPYSPENCRWATRLDNMQNTRRTKLYDYKGEKKTLRELVALSGMNRRALYARLYKGMATEDAISRPLRKGGSILPSR